MHGNLSRESLAELIEALRGRLQVIADHDLRDRDAAAHLQALQRASERLATLQSSLQSDLPPRLRHFLERCSYDKALALAEERMVEQGDH